MKPKSIFGASFEESKKVVDKRILTPEGSGLYTLSSMEPESKAMILFLLGGFFGVMIYGIGVAMPKGFLEPEDVNILSNESSLLIGRIGAVLEPLIVVTIFTFIGLLVVNFFVKKNYAYHLVYANFILIVFVVCSVLAMASVIIGLTVNGTGFLGLIAQTILGCLLFAKLIRKEITDYQEILFGEKDGFEKNQKSIMFMKSLKSILWLLLPFSIINRRFLHIGGVIGDSNLFGIALGFSVILFFLLYSVMIRLFFQSTVSSFYFFKYQDQYYELLNIPDEIWYGKTKAALMARQREAKRLKEEKSQDY